MSKKGAVKTGGTAGRKKAKDSAMAAAMRGERRSTMRCGVCNRLVSIEQYPNHIRTSCRSN